MWESEWFVYIDEPLQFWQWFNDSAGAFCGGNILRDFFFFFAQAFTFEPLDNHISSNGCFLAENSFITDSHFCIFVDDLRARQVVPVFDFPVGLTVRRRDTKRACSEIFLNSCVGN